MSEEILEGKKGYCVSVSVTKKYIPLTASD